MSYAHTATCRFTVSSWSEELLSDIDGKGTTAGDVYYPQRGLSRASVGYAYSGEVEGVSTTTYLMGYRGGDDLVIGLERFEGSIGGRSGSCVLRHEAVHGAGAVSGTVTVVAGMGTGDLSELRGEARLLIQGHSEDGYELVLSYDVG
jgi:hypothetical protein